MSKLVDREMLVIARRELIERVRSKWFLIGTLLGPIVMLAVILVPAILASRDESKVRVAIINQMPADAAERAELDRELLAGFALVGWEGRVVDDPGEAALLSQIQGREINGFLQVPADVLGGGRVTYQGDNGTNAPAMVGYYSGVNPALLALPARRRSWPWALFAVALLGIAGAALFFVWRGSQRPQTVLVVERGNARANGQPLVVADDPERSPEPDPEEGAAPVGTTPPRPDAGAAGAGKPRDGKSRSAEDGDNDLRKRLNRMRPEIARCWSEHAGAATQVTDASVSFKLEPSGKVSSVQLTPAALSTTPTGACIRKVFLATRFPGQKESIDIKLQLSPKARPPI